MKLNTKVNNVEAFGGEALGKNTFKLSNNAKLFELLSNSIYQNKIGAVVRELACNAYDANIANGKKDVPIIISLPSILDPTFRVKDNGPGMSHEEIMNLYTTYGYSSKDDSNDYIGALGIGSKSPLAYTESFTVVSVHEGVKGIYVCSKGSNGIPIIESWSTEDTYEPSGVEVIVPVKDEDRLEFRSEVSKQLKFFDPLPVNENGDILVDGSNLEEEFEYKWENIYSRRRRDYQPYRKVLMGVVAYDFSLEDLDIDTNVKKSVAQCDILIKVPLGAVSITPSRETLQYDSSTKEYLEEQLINLIDVQWGKINEELQKKENMVEAVKYYKKVAPYLREYKSMAWRGNKIDSLVSVKVSLPKSFDIRHPYANHKGLRTAIPDEGAYTENISTDAAIYIKDTHHKYKVKVEDFVTKNPEKHKEGFTIIAPGENSMEDLTKVLTDMGFTYTMISELPDVKVARGSARIYKCFHDTFNICYSYFTKDGEKSLFEREDIVYYSVIKNRQIATKDYKVAKLYGDVFGATKKPENLFRKTYFIPHSRLKEIEGRDNWKPVADYMWEEINKAVGQVGAWASRLERVWSSTGRVSSKYIYDLKRKLEFFGFEEDVYSKISKNMENHKRNYFKDLKERNKNDNYIIEKKLRSVDKSIRTLAKLYNNHIPLSDLPYVSLAKRKPMKPLITEDKTIHNKEILKMIRPSEIMSKAQAEFVYKVMKGDIKL